MDPLYSPLNTFKLKYSWETFKPFLSRKPLICSVYQRQFTQNRAVYIPEGSEMIRFSSSRSGRSTSGWCFVFNISAAAEILLLSNDELNILLLQTLNNSVQTSENRFLTDDKQREAWKLTLLAPCYLLPPEVSHGNVPHKQLWPLEFRPPP